MRAMILAAGEGTRLSPLTLETPKVLLPLAGKPLLEHTIDWLKGHGIRQMTINLCHLGDKVENFLGDGSRLGVEVAYSPEHTLLGTAGGLKRVESSFHDTFVVFYGDVITDFNLSAMIDFHRRKKALATLALNRVANPSQVGIVALDDQSRLTGFVEKPLPGMEADNLANAGVYVLEPEIFSHIPRHRFCDFAYDVFPELIKLDLPLYGYCLDDGDYLADIGTLGKYRQVAREFETKARTAK